MGNINIKNRTYYLFNDMINIKDFDSSLLKINKNLYKNIGIYNIGYSTIKKFDDYESIHSVNPFYLMIGKPTGHIVEQNRSKYVVFDSAELGSTYENKEVLQINKELWNGTKNKIKTTHGGKEGKYEKDFMKTKFNSDDDLPLNKQLKFSTMTIVAISVFEEDGKFYPQVYLDKCLYEI